MARPAVNLDRGFDVLLLQICSLKPEVELSSGTYFRVCPGLLEGSAKVGPFYGKASKATWTSRKVVATSLVSCIAWRVGLVSTFDPRCSSCKKGAVVANLQLRISTLGVWSRGVQLGFSTVKDSS